VRLRRSALYEMNSVVIGEPGHAAVVDPGILPSELDDLAAATAGVAAVTLVFTHGDWDHVLGRPWWPGAATVGHDALAADLRRNRDAIRAEADRVAAAAGGRFERPFEPFRPDDAVSGLRAGRLGSRHAVFRDAFGHSASMLSVHLPELRLLIAGDMLSDIEPPMLTQPPATYHRTLAELLPLAEHGAIDLLVPGHGEPARGGEVAARVRRDLGYLDALARAARDSGTEPPKVDRTAWRASPSVDFEAIHRDNLRVARAASGR
jgi:glyoxylase-like metal-dependent hydrolase (beta-lactamase superfamily II)